PVQKECDVRLSSSYLLVLHLVLTLAYGLLNLFNIYLIQCLLSPVLLLRLGGICRHKLVLLRYILRDLLNSNLHKGRCQYRDAVRLLRQSASAQMDEDLQGDVAEGA
ncbi:unnamed protein product, partial [Prorocentrum cordatum]